MSKKQKENAKELSQIVMGIVNIVMEKAEVPVEKRQAINDECDSVVMDIIGPWYNKAKDWDKLYDEVSKCYCNSEGEYDEENPEIPDADLCTIGEIAASHLGWG